MLRLAAVLKSVAIYCQTSELLADDYPQNYSCPAAAGPSAAPVADGALATLYNATCLTGLLGTDTTNKLTNYVAKQSRDIQVPSLFQSGHHYFPDYTTPTFNLHTTNADYGIDFCKKANATAAPAGASTSQDGSAAVPWLTLKAEQPPLSPYSLSAADTNTVTEVYRINTAGGSAPATCVNHLGSNFTQEYAAEYWFWSS